MGWGSRVKDVMQRQHDIRLSVCQKPDFWCVSSLCRTPQTGKPSEMDHVPLLPEASLLFHEGTQRLLTRKGILVLEADKLLAQVVTLWSFKGTQVHHFHCSLHGIKVKQIHTHLYFSLHALLFFHFSSLTQNLSEESKSFFPIPVTIISQLMSCHPFKCLKFMFNSSIYNT